MNREWTDGEIAPRATVNRNPSTSETYQVDSQQRRIVV